jgi:hypothetical protein
MKNKSLLYKIILVLVLVALCFIMIYIGRGHTLYLDNKGMEVGGRLIEAPYRTKVFIKGKEVANLSDGDRGMGIWIGPKAHLDLEITETKGGDKKKVSYDVELPRKYDGVVINLVGLMNSAPYDTYISEFVPLATTETSEEEVVIDEMGDLGLGE